MTDNDTSLPLLSHMRSLDESLFPPYLIAEPVSAAAADNNTTVPPVLAAWSRKIAISASEIASTADKAISGLREDHERFIKETRDFQMALEKQLAMIKSTVEVSLQELNTTAKRVRSLCEAGHDMQLGLQSKLALLQDNTTTTRQTAPVEVAVKKRKLLSSSDDDDDDY